MEKKLPTALLLCMWTTAVFRVLKKSICGDEIYTTASVARLSGLVSM